MKEALKYYQLVLMVLLVLVIASCQQDELLKEDPVNTGIENPDEVSEYLVFTDANKITGSLPTVATDGQLKIHFKDTLYVLKDFKQSMMIRHNQRYDITGVFIGISNSSFYFDVPISQGGGADSVDVIFFDVDLPSDENLEYPFTIPIKIIPHGPDNLPIDEFEKFITIEDSENSECPISWQDEGLFWRWRSSFHFNYSTDPRTEIFTSFVVPNYTNNVTGGCCNPDGSSSTVANDPYCFQKFTNGSLNPNWRIVQVGTFFQWVADYLWFFNDGTFKQYSLSTQSIYKPSKTDFCKSLPAYEYVVNEFEKSGTYELTSPDYLKITYNATNPPVYGKSYLSSEIFHSCHCLGLVRNSEGGLLKESHVFDKVRFNENLILEYD